MDIRDIFENKIKIESKVMSIESLFNNASRVRNTDFKPSYQRNYVWDDEKATYFIESILLGTEIPPLVFFKNSDKTEVIDGRQRYQTILRFKGNEFKLRKNGLHKLGNIGIANKQFKDIDTELQDLFWDTKLRIIEFSFPSREGISDDIEELVKREIFKRYNSGITPLKPSEIDNAVYLEDDLNAYLKQKIQEDEILNRDISNVFHFEKNNIEIILKRVRQLLVQHEIPIKYYAVKKQSIVSKFYEALFAKIDTSEIENIYQSFIAKLNLLVKIKATFLKQSNSYNRLISECLFWVFSALENEDIQLQKIDKPELIDKLVIYLVNNIESYSLQRSSFSKELYERYSATARFFEQEFDTSLKLYLDTNQEFIQRNNEINPVDDELTSFEELRINKPEPSSIAITDIIRSMDRQRFLIRPQYQRKEVINKKKSSSIIESILLGIKIPPIFVFKREDGVREVLDGQQRILSILGFTGDPYLDENGERTYSNKNGYSLYLKNSILTNLHGNKFNALSLEFQDRIKNFDLWVIEIDKKYNKNFEPIDLFVRLNDKPYPIKEDSFEMWNSYISRDIIDTIKAAHRNHKNWFYFRKNNSRMEDENIYTALSFLQFSRNKNETNQSNGKSEIDIYKIGTKINFRLKSKNEITKTLESFQDKNDFINAINHFEFEFIRKLKELLTESKDLTTISLNKNLDELLLITKGRRTQQSFYALWYFLFDIPYNAILHNKAKIRKDIKFLFSLMASIDEKSTFENAVKSFKDKYSDNQPNKNNTTAFLKEIASIEAGVKEDIKKSSQISSDTHVNYNCLTQGVFKNYSFNKEKLELITIDIDLSVRELFESKGKILISRAFNSSSRFNIAISNDVVAFKNNIIGLVLNRPNFIPKYILALLSSRFYFHKYYIEKRKDQEETKPLSLTDINEIEIPIIDLDSQIQIANIVDYIIHSEGNHKATLFFERVLDALVYEIFFDKEFKEKEIEIKNYISTFPKLEAEPDNEKKAEAAEKLYAEISSPEHNLGGNFLSLLNIPQVIEIESHY
ncbi:DUF262 domain-containing protein [Sinomicrobium pectinilyticum]|uniref:DUF262 domain-containing protein n=1 Tax=Sinomicrobium pectinilyticum TaxID=1084421 RepID=A0A3N0EX41_SINP1|nr:DUF262 domain-containing protein [Sinomicrobium pectinilyticum]RNL92282.1 DUF262 domain-containing protein [Sinomicrobium pectinilyticum]